MQQAVTTMTISAAAARNRHALAGAWDKKKVLLSTPEELRRERETDQKRKANPPLVVPQSWEPVALGVKPHFYVRVKGRSQIVRSGTVRMWDVGSKTFKYLRENYDVNKTTRARKKRKRRRLHRQIRKLEKELDYLEGGGFQIAAQKVRARRDAILAP